MIEVLNVKDWLEAQEQQKTVYNFMQDWTNLVYSEPMPKVKGTLVTQTLTNPNRIVFSIKFPKDMRKD